MADIKKLVKKIMSYYPMKFMQCKRCIKKNDKLNKSLKKIKKDKKGNKDGL